MKLNIGRITKLKGEFTNKNYLFFNENIINFRNNTQYNFRLIQ